MINIEALSKVTLASIPLSFLATLMEEPAVLKVIIRCLSASLERHWEAKAMLAKRSTKERYAWFLQRYPGPIDRVNDQYIASFLGVSPVTFSRVRHAVAVEKRPAAGRDIPREGE